MNNLSNNLSKLAEPFSADDIEWRVSRAGMGAKGGIYCRVLCYITARACFSRLDEVCGVANWKLEQPKILEIDGKSAFACGLSIRIGDDGWVTKWDVSSPTYIEPAKGGWSSAAKRAAAVWGLGRYLYYLTEDFAEVSETDPQARGWHYAKLPDKAGGGQYYWRPPTLPAWALPKEAESEVSQIELNDLKRAWQDKFSPDSNNRADLVAGFSRFVYSLVGSFPASDFQCWTRAALDRCSQRITETTDPNGVSPDVPFEE
jgi:hypothetical protein